MAPPTITLRSPSKYIHPSTSPSASGFQPPPLTFVHRTWTVSHSTLSMWRTAQNVRITYGALPPTAKNKSPPQERIDDLVEYESLSGKGTVKTIAGIDTAAKSGDCSVWDWRGKGLLALLSSRWELLGWGEQVLEDGTTERWMVSWFAATLFTGEGLDLLSDRRQGPSRETAEAVLKALGELEAREVAELVRETMKPVAISLPWKER